jgi:hypothetical protein
MGINEKYVKAPKRTGSGYYSRGFPIPHNLNHETPLYLHQKESTRLGSSLSLNHWTTKLCVPAPAVRS